MIYKKLNFEEDFTVLKSFWEKSEMKIAPTPNMLSPHGIVAIDDKKAIVGAIFQFFILDTGIVLIGYPILNPDLKENRSEVLDKLYEVAETTASYNGYNLAQTFTPLDFVRTRLDRNGWVLGDEKVDWYAKCI